MCGPDGLAQQYMAANTPTDPKDFTDQYNTSLNPQQEQQFQSWTKNNQFNRDLSKDTYDYDLRGYWKNNQNNYNGDKSTGHLTDEYKKPNHPTFSDQSIYSGINGNIGGKWSATSDNKWSFTPSETTMKLWNKSDLQKYWDQVEAPQGNTIVFKGGI